MSARPPRGAGFTLIEAMVTVALVAILAAIALPGYSEYVQRSKLVEARVSLSDMRTRLEQYFFDERSYPNICVPPATGPAPAGQIYLPVGTRYFSVDCDLAPTRYTVTATGKGAHGMAGFVYSVDETNRRRTLALPAGWAGNGNGCWVSRKSGEC